VIQKRSRRALQLGNGDDVAPGDNCPDRADDVAYGTATKSISYSKATIKTLRRMPRNVADLIRSKVEANAEDSASQANNVKALKGQEGFRLRVGEWRVIMDDQGNVLSVRDIGTRGGVYN
jgi:mRNA interferase RelE/StbE